MNIIAKESYWFAALSLAYYVIPQYLWEIKPLNNSDEEFIYKYLITWANSLGLKRSKRGGLGTAKLQMNSEDSGRDGEDANKKMEWRIYCNNSRLSLFAVLFGELLVPWLILLNERWQDRIGMKKTWWGENACIMLCYCRGLYGEARTGMSLIEVYLHCV